MGLTYESVKKDALKDMFNIDKNDGEYVIALAGNPNTGKSTVFNTLTGLHQHTGNWPGKTVVNARGEFQYKDKKYILVDLPGTYSIFATSVEEAVARDFICFGKPDLTIVVVDATSLERNLNLAFQVMEITSNMILCINLIDEAERKGITIDGKGLEKDLGIPVVLTSARNNIGMDNLKEEIDKKVAEKLKSLGTVKHNYIKYDSKIEKAIDIIKKDVEELSIDLNSRWLSLRLIDGDKSIIKGVEEYLGNDEIKNIIEKNKDLIDSINNKEIREDITSKNYKQAELLRDSYVKISNKKVDRDKKIDDIITSKRFGIPLMMIMLAVVLWITIAGANVPSQMLADMLFKFQDVLTDIFIKLNAPEWLHGVLILGLYKTMAWVISVMLPPMAIFFPLFTLLEDFGYLPRVAFNLDHVFKKACAHGKQCLSMCMGLGCNAAGVIGCRIIDSPRERLIAILTNNFVPCNGRFPTLIAVSTVFFGVATINDKSNIIPALIVSLIVILGILITLGVSYLLSKTLLKGIPSSFTLELPPYRKPKFGSVLYTSIIDRTIFVLGRAVAIAAPAGVAIWILGNIYIGDMSIISHVAKFLNPFAQYIGLDGFILLAFILGLPANEIVVPILLMAYLSTGSMIEFESIDSLRQILVSNGWTTLTALNVLIFTLLHWPCATTLLTIKKETGSIKWTILAAILPTVIGIGLCFITTTIYKLVV
ncbi:ferrous iron transport protein B [Clostridium intestinale]|uniref:Ferrous iron transport protein B n=1 Tax=Clostridium intestinale URNW TaxID=1294142 RepID=U2N891_9CLOT|nr:ferrous iron transport protein B [Clostridium intestinale]ERK31742.1 ferrous iron transport protein B [Clostridium intestinale URNW]